MKITIEHEYFSATTTSLVVAERLLETIRLLQNATQPKHQSIKPATPIKPREEETAPKPDDIFDTTNTSDIPTGIFKPSLPRFNPAWLEKHIDFSKSSIVRYSNPCSTLHGKNGEKCWQTELLVKTGEKLDTCDCEFYDLDELRGTLDAYIKIANMEVTGGTKHESHCSRKRLEQVADLVNQGCSNKQIAERLSISLSSVATYKHDCKKQNMLK